MKIAVVTGASSGMGRDFVYAIDKEYELDEIWVIARRADRLEELKKIIKSDNDGSDNQILLGNLLDEIIFIENQLVELKKLPFISVNPNNNAQQKATPASKQYKELLQQYINALKVIAKSSGQDLDNEESPLRKWVKKKVSGV